MKKLRHTLWMAGNLIMARTFGEYVHSIGGAGFPYSAIYRWRGRSWSFPTSPLNEAEGE